MNKIYKINETQKTVDCKHAECAWFVKHKKGTDFVFLKSLFEKAVS